MSLTLAVVIYNNGHRCLYAAEDVESREERGTVFEAQGRRYRLQREAFAATARCSSQCQKLYQLGEIEEDDFAGVMIAISQVPLKNDEKDWGCKNYVIDCMEKLERLGFLDENDEDYSKAKTELQEIISSTRRDADDGDDDDKDNGEGDNGEEEEEDDDDGDDDEPRNLCSSALVENSSDEE